MPTISEAVNDKQFDAATRAAAGRLTAMGYGNVGIRSGHRDKEHNAKVGGAKDSQHIHGKAFDIAGATSWSEKQRADFHAAAQAAGFMGHGFYGTGAVHIDTGPARSWGANKNQSWARAALRTAPVARPSADVVASPNPDKSLPAGMRNYNPGNLKYNPDVAWDGLAGPSQNTDQGDPQAVFTSPEMGMRATAKLAMNKYAAGMTTPNQIVAGPKGWTPGNFQAAANVAAAMGIGPDDDMGLNDPKRTHDFVRGIVTQEHGPASKQYTDDMIDKGIQMALAGPTDVNPSLMAQAPSSVPALSYMPSKEAVSPAATQSTPTAAAWGGVAAPKSALGAIEAIAPSGALSPSRPTESIVGQYADMSRYAPQAPAGPTAMAAAQTRPALDAALANPTARQEDTNFGGINPSSMMNENFPGLSMPAAPTGPTGAETLYSKAQDPATFAGALAAAQPQQAPPSVPSAPPSALYSPTSLATAPTALGAVPTAIGTQPATPMGLAAPGVGALPQLNVPSQMMAPPALTPPAAPPMAPPALQAPPAAWAAESQSFPDAPAAPPSYTPSDIYGGQVGTATASDGNTVGRDPFGATTVTNKYGVTTAMTPTGKQSAYGPGFGPVGGLLGGAMFGGQKMSEKTKGMLAGAAMGALAGGLPGAIAGGMLGRQVGGYVGKNSFPSAPSKANDRSGVAGGDRTAAERSSRSPAAADHIGRGGGMTGLW